jgi:hypothetical protein
MNCETYSSHTSCLVGAYRSVEDPRRARHWAHLRVTDLYAVGSFDPDHDAVMRIGGEAPGGGPILSVSIKCQVRIRLPATSDLNSAVVLKSQCERRMVLSGTLVPISRFTWLVVRRRPPMAHQ